MTLSCYSQHGQSASLIPKCFWQTRRLFFLPGTKASESKNLPGAHLHSSSKSPPDTDGCELCSDLPSVLGLCTISRTIKLGVSLWGLLNFSLRYFLGRIVFPVGRVLQETYSQYWKSVTVSYFSDFFFWGRNLEQTHRFLKCPKTIENLV